MFEEISTSTRLKGILRSFPELTDYFLEMGLCGCGDESLDWTVERAAKEKGKKPDEMLDEIRRRIKK